MGPLAVLKNFAPLLKASDAQSGEEDSALPRSTAVFYSARVGSIGDNATGVGRNAKVCLQAVMSDASKIHLSEAVSVVNSVTGNPFGESFASLSQPRASMPRLCDIGPLKVGGTPTEAAKQR